MTKPKDDYEEILREIEKDRIGEEEYLLKQIRKPARIFIKHEKNER